MTKNEFHFRSCDGQTQIHAIEWVPEGKVRAVLQICHGMVEYIDRYDEFARYLAEKGIYVVGHDHLGHGESVQNESDYGYFHHPDGNQCVIGDIHKLRWWTQKRCAGIPYFMLGHSMGSFLLRQYLLKYSKGLTGAIIMGTGYHSKPELLAGQILCRILAQVKGWKYKSRLVNEIGIGGFNKKFEPAETSKDWITTDPDRKAAYIADPLCNFMFTVNGYYEMFEGMKALEVPGAVFQINEDLAVLFVSGNNDPVGNFGKSVRKIFKRYKDAGIQDVELTLYRGDRHEILNEVDRQKVYEDIFLWLEDRL